MCREIVGGDVYPVPDGDQVPEGFDILCILDGANNDNSWGRMTVLPTGLQAGDIYPCDAPDSVIESSDLLSVIT